MKLKPAVYWTATGLTAASMAVSAELYFSRNPQMMKQFKALGYPTYFPIILGVFKVLGVAALLLPGGRGPTRLSVARSWTSPAPYRAVSPRRTLPITAPAPVSATRSPPVLR